MRSNLIKTLPFLENDEVDGAKKQKSPDKRNVEPMDIDESEDSAVKDKNEEEKSEEDGQNATIQQKVEKEEKQDALLDATPCQAKE